jgi:hypothetical protein
MGRHQEGLGMSIEIASETGGPAFTVPAEVIAEGLGLPAAQVQALLAQRQISSWVEAGTNENLGTFRLTFASERRRLRLIVNALGDIVSRSTLDFGTEPLPPGSRRPQR